MFGCTKKYSGIHFVSKGVTYIDTTLDTRRPYASSIKNAAFLDETDEKSFLKAKEVLNSAFVVATLAKTDYQLIKIETPSCTEKEMEHEILWSIQDQIPFEIDDTIVRWFDCPSPNIQKQYTFALAIDGVRFSQRLNFLSSLGCTVVDITIPELAKSALLTREAPEDHYIVFLDISEHEQGLLVTKNGDLIFSKKLPKDFLLSKDFSPEDVKTLSNIIQQTVSSLGISSNYKVVIPTYAPFASAMADKVDSSINGSIGTFETKEHISRRIEDQTLLCHALIALGGIVSYVQNS